MSLRTHFRLSPAALLHYAKSEASDVQSANQSCCCVVAGIVATGLWQCHSCGCSHVHAWPAPVCAQCSSKVDTRKTEVWPCYSIAPWPALDECPKLIKFRLTYSSSAVAATPCHRTRTWQETCTGLLTTVPDIISDSQLPTSWSCHVHNAQPLTFCCNCLTVFNQLLHVLEVVAYVTLNLMFLNNELTNKGVWGLGSNSQWDLTVCR